jgi:hypothetical protein
VSFGAREADAIEMLALDRQHDALEVAAWSGHFTVKLQVLICRERQCLPSDSAARGCHVGFGFAKRSR